MPIRILLFASMASLLMACGNSSNLSPVAYNDSLVTQQIRVVDAALNLQEVLDTYVKEDMETVHGRLQEQIRAALEKTQSFGDFKGDEQFKNATAKFIQTYQQLAEKEYREAMVLLSKPDSLYSKTDEARVEMLYKQIDKITAEANLAYQKAQDAFAQAYGIQFNEKKP